MRKNIIPDMVDPLGKHWRQPKDIQFALMDDTHVLLTPAQWFGLSHYDRSMPSGTYAGKCWGWNGPQGERGLFWYGDDSHDEQFMVIHRREVIILQ